MSGLTRRSLLKGAAVGLGAAAAGPFQGVAARAATIRAAGAVPAVGPDPGYGPLVPIPDLRDGQVRLHLPEGFSYRSFTPRGFPMDDGVSTPARHDGMACFNGPGENFTLIRNHEINGPVGAFGDPATAYDTAAGGGTTRVVVTRFGEVISSEVSNNGTQMNCSGGPMPWGAWVTCEETVNGPDVGNDFSGGNNALLQRKHGFIYEVPARAGSPRLLWKEDHADDVILFDTPQGRAVVFAVSVAGGTVWSSEPRTVNDARLPSSTRAGPSWSTHLRDISCIDGTHRTARRFGRCRFPQ